MHKIYRKLLFNNLSIVWNIKILLVQISEIAWEEFEKVGFATFREFAKKRKTEMGVAYITRFKIIHQTRGYKVFECAIKYMGALRQNALSLIIAPPSGGISQWQ